MTSEPILIDVIPDSKEWLEARRKGLGASDAPAALGFSSWKSGREVALDKWGEAEQQVETPQMHRGHVSEPAILLAYSMSAQVKTEQGVMLRHPEHDWMTATPDGFVMPFAETRTLIQVKTANLFVRDEWGEDGSGDIPEIYEIQVRHEMAVANADSVDIPVVFADEQLFTVLVKMIESGISLEMAANVIKENLDFRVYTIERDLGIEKSLIEAEKEFWETYIVPHVLPPDLKAHKTKANTLREANEEDIKELAIAKKHWLALKRAEIRLEKKKETLQRLIGTDEGVNAGDGEKVTWKSKDRNTIDWKAVAMTCRNHLPMFEWDSCVNECTKTTTSRTFLFPVHKWKKEM